MSVTSASPGTAADYEIVIVGGGFFGCCLALLFRSITDSVLLIERGASLMERASAVNQARVHCGLHYPRSFPTARRSQKNFPLFAAHFHNCIVDDFEMLYAIARHRSRVSANRFEAMFRAMNAPIEKARTTHGGLFNSDLIEAVFTCREYAFDYLKLREHVATRLETLDVPISFSTTVERVAAQPGGGVELTLSDGQAVTARTAFNTTYAQINALLMASGLSPYPLKHELAEIALITPPADLDGLAVTVMDGPFFSAMPFPAVDGAYSLTHVRYTPQASWTDAPDQPSAYDLAAALPQQTRWQHMAHDAARYLPCMEDARWQRSLFEVKTVLARNEGDDGRPILLHEHTRMPRLFTVLGGKIDNIYDLFEILPRFDPNWAGLSPKWLLEE
ncbi:MAG: FAD-dependent oxidoreductase [Hyphomicrobiales bacterium]